MIVFWVAVAIVVLDQWTKEIIRGTFSLDEIRPVIDGFFNLVYVRNTGAAFGLLNGRNLALAAVSVAMLVFLVLARRSFLGGRTLNRVAYGLLLGGILGNLVDRVRLGYVVDFLDFVFGSYRWPSFNVADASICVGFGLYFLGAWLQRPPAASPDTPAGPPADPPHA